MIKRSYLCGGSILAVSIALGLSAPASAQAPARAAAPAPADVEEVVVTGSYIAGTPEDAALPVDVLSAKDLEQQGSPTVVQLVKTITASSSGIGESNRYNGGAGTASINLRGFGASRTLSLFNGRRMADSPAAAFQGGGADLNFIPTAAIGRIEILKDGAAATYGSDAIGGVVNFITRTDLDGLELEGEYSHIEDSDGDYHLNAAWGKKWDGGNLLATLGYRHRSRLDIRDRSWALRGFDFGGYAGGAGFSGNSNPGFYQTNTPAPAASPILFRDNGCEELGGTLTNSVTFANSAPGTTGTTVVPVPVSAQNPAVAGSQCRYRFSTFNDLVNHEEHYQAYAEFNTEFLENHKFHAEVAWNKNVVPNQRISPANGNTQFPTPTQLGGESGSMRNPQAINFFVPFNVPSNNPGLVDLYTTCAAPLTATQCGAIQTAANTARPTTGPFAGSLGGSRLNTAGVDISQTAFRFIANAGHPTNPDKADHQDIEETEFRVSASVQGELPWFGIHYDTALTYMEAEQVTNTNDLLVERAQLALNGFGSLSNDPGSCSAAERQVAANAGNNAVGCYFFNPFTNSVAVSAATGATNPYFHQNVANNPKLVEWLYGNYTNTSLNELLVYDLVFSGKTGITLPGGEVAMAAGYQWRYNRDKNDYGDLFNNKATPCVDSVVDGTPVCNAPNGPLIFFGSNADADSDRAVWAVFGEVQIPLLDNLEVNIAVRHEDYPGGIGSTTNPKIAAKWQIFDWLAVRGTAGTTFRAPTIAAASNECAIGVANLGGSYRAVRTCGNPQLGPEKADTYSAGVIFDYGGLKATLDYYRFDFTGELTSEPASGLLGALAATGAGQGCANPALVARFQFDATIGCTANGAGVLRIDVNNVNGPDTKTSGLDFRAQYDWSDFLLAETDWQVGLEATYLIEYKRGDFVLAGTSTVFQAALDRAGTHDLLGAFFSYPQTKANGWLSFHHGPLTARWQVQFTEGTTPAVSTAGFYRTVPNPGATATGAACTAAPSASCAGRDLVYNGKSHDFWQHNLILRYDAPWDTVITASIQNIFDKDPPFLVSNFNYDYTNGNPLGRVFEIGFKKEF